MEVVMFEGELDITWEVEGEGEGEGEERDRFNPSEVDGIPVTLTLYHLVRLGGHSSLAVILLLDPSLIVV
jgi:hypothetical protein